MAVATRRSDWASRAAVAADGDSPTSRTELQDPFTAFQNPRPQTQSDLETWANTTTQLVSPQVCTTTRFSDSLAPHIREHHPSVVRLEDETEHPSLTTHFTAQVAHFKAQLAQTESAWHDVVLSQRLRPSEDAPVRAEAREAFSLRSRVGKPPTSRRFA